MLRKPLLPPEAHQVFCSWEADEDDKREPKLSNTRFPCKKWHTNRETSATRGRMTVKSQTVHEVVTPPPLSARKIDKIFLDLYDTSFCNQTFFLNVRLLYFCTPNDLYTCTKKKDVSATL